MRRAPVLLAALLLKQVSALVNPASPLLWGVRGMVSSAAVNKLYVKQAVGGTGLGDCPFCHKANMALRLKTYPFEYELVDLSNKPESYLKLNEKGTVPTLVTTDGSVLTESDDILKLADAFDANGPKLNGGANVDAAGALCTAVWKSTGALLRNKDESAGAALKKDFDEAMGALESFKKSNGGKFLAGGDAPSGADCKAAPFLLHAAVALPHFNKMDPIFASYPSLQAYMSQLDALDAYKQSKYPDDVIIAGWAAKLA